uniref:DUF4352 domain-containing protein n=1 Tax=uncultured Allobacillus sp. TaxID=1638025 RepID=UPI002596AF4A|nr:DUF4352 domain-containing protein [uncultured Allobacillus sp.]
MKKLFYSIALLLLVLSLVACGGEAEAENVDNEDEEQSSEDEQAEEDESEAETENTYDVEESEKDEDESETMTHDENQNKEAHEGDVVTSEIGDARVVSRVDDFGTFESGPIKVTIDKANGVSLDVSDGYVEYFETDQLEYFQVDLTVENTSEDKITFYASQATMTTSTGEQIEKDRMQSDHIDADFLGPVTKNGTLIYTLENSNAEDVESIKLFFSAPLNDNWDDMGEELEIEIPLQ